jgi:uncharacterized damage-inducible protein DinB
MHNHFQRMLAYNVWANNRIFQSLSDQNGDPEMWGKFSHLILAEQVWQSRIEGRTFSGPGIFDLLPQEEIGELMKNNESGWKRIFESQADFSKTLPYKLLNGSEGNSTLSDILTHVFNHGTYHRGQIATLMRQKGLEPVATDFIGFARL